jgi:drug/metabolite transporter (DMT)-like permease
MMSVVKEIAPDKSRLGSTHRRLMAAPLLVWLILSGIWGSTWLFIKVGLRDLPPVSFAGIRFVIAAFVLVMIVIAQRLPLPRTRRDWLFIAVTGFLSFTVNYGLLFWGEQHVSSGLAAVLQATIPLFGLLIAHRLLPAERMTATKVFGVLLGLAGVGVIFSNQMHAGGSLALWGSAAIVLGAFAVALSNVLIKARGAHFDPAVLASGQMIFGLVPLLIVGFIKEGNPINFHWTRLAVVSLFYLALIGSSLAFMLFYWLVRRMAVTNTMLISLVTPVLAVLLGMGAIGEQLSWRMGLGGAGILTGIAMMIFCRGE